MRLSVAVVPGDGVGPEVVAQAVGVLERLSREGLFELAIETFPWSADHTLATGETLPDGAIGSLRGFDAILAGAFGDPRIPDNRHADDILLGMRRRLDLFANVRPARCLHESLSPLRGRSETDIDFVVVRENTEGAYAGVGGTFRRDTPDEIALEEDVSTRRGVERAVRFAFALAARRRGLVHLADKHNAQRFAGGLWKRVFLEVAREHPGVEARHMFADAMAMEMVRHPDAFDVVVASNLFGDILSDVGAALVGGPGMAPSGSFGASGPALFEPVHGSAPALAGRGVANPFAAILSAGMLLEGRGLDEAVARVTAAVRACVAGGLTTADLGGSLSTAEAGAAVLERL